jgi:hypothetical protein
MRTKICSKFVKAAILVMGSVLPWVTTVAPVHAATVTFDWTLTVPSNVTSGGFPFLGNGTITVTTAATGGDPMTAITGTIGSGVITGLSTFDGADNLLFPNTAGTSLLDHRGFSFTVGTQSINILSQFSPGQITTGNAYEEIASNPGGFGVGIFTLTQVAAVPEASTWAMMILGFAGVGFMAYRRRKDSTLALTAV